MPPATRFHKEDIVQAGISVVRKSGIEALTARAVAEELGCSTQPLFSSFKDMDELKEAVLDESRRIYRGYIEIGLDESLPFKGFGRQSLRFARDEPRLSKALFQSEVGSMEEFMENDPNHDDAIEAALRTFDLELDQAQELYMHLWVYMIGMSVICQDGAKRMSDEEIDRRLSQACSSFLAGIKNEYNMKGMTKG